MENNKLELSFKAVIIGVVLALLLCGANIYLGLKIGSTISASIPAAILSLGILRLFKKYSILENNIAQTIASSGEAVAVPIIFVIPAMLMLGIWHYFYYWQIFLFGICGGFIGIAYSVILRKALLRDKSLPFPEGNAIGKVLLATNNTENKSDFKVIIKAMGISAVINLCQNGFKVLGDSYYKFLKIGNSAIGMGASFSPAVIGSGFLIGGNAIVGFIGLLIGWLILLPYFTLHYGVKDSTDLVGSAFFTWKHYVRPVGIGVFLFSGVSTILILVKPILAALQEGVSALRNMGNITQDDQDLNIKKLMLLVVVCIIPVSIFMYSYISATQNCGIVFVIIFTAMMSLLVLVLGFMIAAVAGYMVGLVGSSNSPVSGLLFIAVIVLSLVVKMAEIEFSNFSSLIAIVVLMVSFIGFSAAIISDNIQDFKSGQLVGATPYKQQISLFIGATASLILAPIMINFIFQAYGISGVAEPHPGMNVHNMLNAPQASAIAMVTKNIILGGSSEWALMGLGVLIGIIAFIFDVIGKSTSRFRFPVIMIGTGLYLPPDLVTGLFIGGLLSMVVKRKQAKLKAEIGEEKANELDNKTNVLVCGLIAGESLMGLFLAVPFVLRQSSDALRIVGSWFYGDSQFLSLIVTIGLLLYIYYSSTKVKSVKG